MKKVLPVLVVLGIGGYLGHHYYVDSQVKEYLSNKIEEVNKDPNKEIIHGAYGYGFDNKIFIKDIKVKNASETLDIGDIYISNLDLDHEIPYHVNLELKNFKLPLEKAQHLNRSQKKFVKILNNINKDGTMANLSFSYDYNPKNNHSFDTSYEFELQNTGDVKFSFSMSDFNLEAMSEDPAMEKLQDNPNPMLGMMILQKQLQTLKVKNINFELNNDKFLNTMLEIEAEKKKLSMADFESEIVVKMDKEINKAKSVKHKELITVMKSFLMDKNGLSLDIQPEDKTALVLFQELQKHMMTKDYDAFSKTLGVTFKSK
jgi:uncharacterized Zn ribbon protein